MSLIIQFLQTTPELVLDGVVTRASSIPLATLLLTSLAVAVSSIARF